jgi:hypothetical protein
LNYSFVSNGTNQRTQTLAHCFLYQPQGFQRILPELNSANCYLWISLTFALHLGTDTKPCILDIWIAIAYILLEKWYKNTVLLAMLCSSDGLQKICCMDGCFGRTRYFI